MPQIYGEACSLWLKPLVAPLPRRLKHFQEGSWSAGSPWATALSRMYLKLHSHGRLLAARIGILPFFFLKSIKKETRAIEKELKGKMPILTAESSSVAIWGGGFGLPIGMQSMQNTLFLLLLRPIFALKAKISPPLALAMRMWLLWLWTWREFGRKTRSQPGRRPFFWSSPNFGQKTGPHPSEGFLHLISGKKTFQFQI